MSRKAWAAAAAGLAPGDVISAFDGAEVQDTNALMWKVAAKDAGNVVSLQLMRAGKEMTVVVTLGARPEDYALSYQADRLYNLDKFAESLATARQALASAEKRVGLDDERVAQLLLRVAEAYEALHKDLAESEPLRKRAIAIMEKAFGAEHPDVAEAVERLAANYRKAGRDDDALPLYVRALLIRLKAPRPNGAITDPLRSIAYSYERKNLHTEAEQVFQRVMAMVESARGPGHPDVRHPLEMLAQYYEIRRRHDAAEPLRRRRSRSPRRLWDLITRRCET